jgi:hypothetical protein
MSWRNCQASLVLVEEINRRWPSRDKSSDGTIGDAAHAVRTSDHNPWVVHGGIGIVRARDVDKDGIDAAWCVEHLRQLGARRDPRLYPNGYVIFNRRITKPDFSGWAVYTGSNPHDHHFHVSFTTSPAGFDSSAPWGIATAPAAPAEKDWFDMATRDELAAVIRAELAGVIRETTSSLPNRRGPNGAYLKGGPTDTLFGFAMNVDGIAYRIEQALAALAARPGSALVTGALSDADKDDIAERVVRLLGAKASS